MGSSSELVTIFHLLLDHGFGFPVVTQLCGLLCHHASHGNEFDGLYTAPNDVSNTETSVSGASPFAAAFLRPVAVGGATSY
mmetsp:Transcript_7955/g.16578  ORF Transcript_7955/g.16578 Transcript_7955/m.16578 type:complete len:81 (-) Transcript_7955:862-1104(-)